MFHRYFLAAIGLLVSMGAATAQTSNSAPGPATPESTAQEMMEDLQLGDHWTYEIRDDISGDVKSTLTNTVTDVSGSEVGVRIDKLGSSHTGYQTFDRSWNLIRSNDWRYAPNDGTGIRAPLAVGNTWSFKSNDLNNTVGTSWRRSGTSKVTAQESITTPAGTFDTFKIETSFREQNANNPTRNVQAVQETWYAPAINHWVRRSVVARSDGRVREKNTVELVEYGRR